ncbi:ovomucoid-like [Pristis pectinata]|uniref:ovomucoid-like n=1 Tax=Pristis pectinata TaxID=685728 RepID=UPI00223D8055|nr:ovomucoid-like [Pristis pectinata]
MDGDKDSDGMGAPWDKGRSRSPGDDTHPGSSNYRRPAQQQIQPYCKDIPKRIPLCDQNRAPVCGTNGVTYGNECRLCAAVWATRVKIKIQKYGNC